MAGPKLKKRANFENKLIMAHYRDLMYRVIIYLGPPSLAMSVYFVGVIFIYSETTAYCDLRGVSMIPFQCRKILAIARPFDVIFCKFPLLRGI